MAAVTLLYRKGHFRQEIGDDGWQREVAAAWPVEEHLEEMGARTAVEVEGRTVHLRAWKREVTGIDGFAVPVYFIDSDLSENSDWDRTLTHHLYGGDDHYRLSQEVILGIGGVRILRELGYGDVKSFHMNEGHAALLTLEILDEAARAAGRREVTEEDRRAVQAPVRLHHPLPPTPRATTVSRGTRSKGDRTV